MSNGNEKSKVVAGILGILLGGLGIHHFYLGNTTTGIVVLLLSCLCLGGIIGLVEGIMLLVMSDEDFNARYNSGRNIEGVEFVFQQPK